MQNNALHARSSLFYLFSMSILLLLLSFLLLLVMSTRNSPIPNSILMLMLLNGTSSVFNTDSGITDSIKPPPLNPIFPDSITTSNASSTDGDITDSIEPPPPSPILPDSVSTSNNSTPSLPKDIKGCSLDQAKLKVYMYDLPPAFHFGLLGWKGNGGETWPDTTSDIDRVPRYPGGMNMQHSVEYWLTLDLLSSNSPEIVRPCFAVRVDNSSSADVVFVPFFSSLSYNKFSKIHMGDGISMNRFLQLELLRLLSGMEEWKKSGGKDHVIVAHHPNSMLQVRKKLKSATFVLADFGRYPVQVANVKKDVVAPYLHVVKSAVSNSAPFDARPILAFFQGGIRRKDGGVIRQKLYRILRNEEGVHFAYGTPRGNGVERAGRGMASSKFCLSIAGDTPSSNRLFDAIVSHCVPVVVSDKIELPFELVLDYTEFCIFVRSNDAVRNGYLVKLLRGIKREEWTKMWERLKQVAHHFEYQYPSLPGDAVQMIWEAIYRKFNSVSSEINRKNRYRQSQFPDHRYGLAI